MFCVGDRVKLRYVIFSNLDYSANGVVLVVDGGWISVQHDLPAKGTAAYRKTSSNRVIGPRFQYKPEELEHENPLLRLASEI